MRHAVENLQFRREAAFEDLGVEGVHDAGAGRPDDRALAPAWSCLLEALITVQWQMWREKCCPLTTKHTSLFS